MSSKKQGVLVVGGAGFVGSHIAARFCEDGWQVTVLDGLLPKTGGRRKNLDAISKKIKFVPSAIEDTPDLSNLIQQSDVIVDGMAWTAHTLAAKDPMYDLRLNLESHWHLIQELANHSGKTVIYLGTRGQYGSPNVSEITEETPMVPQDIQGTHKLAAESALRIHSKTSGTPVISLRFGNCYGPNQMASGPDLGLVGNFLRDLLEGKTVEVFGANRFRPIVYVKDVAEVVLKLAKKPAAGFQAFNLSGERIQIGELVKTLIKIIGRGSSTIKEMPQDIKAMDIGGAIFSEAKLKTALGALPNTALTDGLRETVAYFRSLKRDLSM